MFDPQGRVECNYEEQASHLEERNNFDYRIELLLLYKRQRFMAVVSCVSVDLQQRILRIIAELPSVSIASCEGELGFGDLPNAEKFGIDLSNESYGCFSEIADALISKGVVDDTLSISKHLAIRERRYL